MLLLKNTGTYAFKNLLKNRKVFVFGAGKALESCIDIYFSETDLVAIVDNNQNLWGKKIQHQGTLVPVIGVDGFIKIVSQLSIKDAVLMIATPYYAAEIIQQLDEIPELNGLETYLQVLIRNTKENYPDYDFTKGSPKIPKKIHYIWVGGKKLPDEFQRNIDTWKKYNPDYEIIRWDESNYDFNKCDYVREAYESKSWGFVPNFARLDIIWQHGGIYLDTDVEVVKKFDVLLNDQAFLCMGTTDRVNNGCGFGAVAKHPIIHDLRNVFEKEHFIINGKPGRKPCHTFLHPVLRKYGFQINNVYQNINGTVLYPKEVMSPLTIPGMPNFLSNKTVSIHKEEGAWKNEKEKNGILKLQNLIENRIGN